jgi:DNA-binding response OmpR family regulator
MISPSASLQPHLLLVDDTDDDLRLLTRILHSSYRVSVALNGDQGYQRAVALQPDMILMDVSMPRMNGFAACRLLKANPATTSIPLLFLSNAIHPDQRIEGLSIGAVDYVLKPYVVEEVLARIRIHLRLAGRVPAAVEPTATAVAPQLDDDDVVVQAAVRLIDARLANPPTLADLALRVGTHEKRLTAAFRRQLGLTVFGYLREQRLRRACTLLRESTISIDNLAALIGFHNACNFSTAFREQMGVTPSEYRGGRPPKTGT